MEGDEATRRRADDESSDDEDCMFNPDMFVNRKYAPCTPCCRQILISSNSTISYTKQAFTFGKEPDSRFTVELTVLPSASSTFLSRGSPPAPGSAILPTAPLCVCVCVLCVAAMAPADFDLTG